MAESNDLSRRLATLAVEARPGAAALEIMRLSLFDWAACAIAGTQEPVSRIIRAVEADNGGRPEASTIGSTTRLPARAAALVNGTISHALDYDDTHFDHIGHPSVAVVPAALAVAEANQARGQDLLEAATLGAEASIRVGIWLGRSHYQMGFHQTATAGAFGATVAAGRLLGLSAAQMGQALALTATRAAGLKSQFGTMGKPYNAGIAAETGVQCARLAALGFASAPMALEAPQGFGPTHGGQADDSAWEGFGTDWRLLRISHKFHACCHGLHAMLEALAQVQVAPETIDRITVTTHPRWMSVCNQEAPTTGLGAKFSYRMTAAMALGGWDTSDLANFSDAACTDPQLVTLRDKVTVVADEGCSETEAHVTLEAGGQSHQLHHDLRASLDPSALTEKLRHKAGVLLGARAPDLWSALFDPSGPNLTALCTLLREA